MQKNLEKAKELRENMEEEIIKPISKELLKSELTPERMLRMTNRSHNEIYVVTAKTAANVMKEF